MHLFIFSKTYDTHAIVVKAALESLGINVTRFTSNCFPVAAEISCLLDGATPEFHIFHPYENPIYGTSSPVDVVWLRRPTFPNTEKLDLHPDDIDTVQKECREFWQSFLPYVFPEANWINPWLASKRCHSKLLQLTTARHCGLATPRTLASNRPDDVREFITSNSAAGRGTIAKSFHPVWWEHDKGVKVMYTAKIAIDGLPADHLLRAVPAIYQEAIPKAFEVRSTFFGNRSLHAKIIATKNGSALQDWRHGYYSELQVSPHVLPLEVEEKCLKLMANLGLKFGCFDFIVTPDGEYIFLEVNEAGQFLWVEGHCPELKMLSEFCHFILREGGQPQSIAPDLALAEVNAWPHVCATLAQEKLQYAER